MNVPRLTALSLVLGSALLVGSGCTRTEVQEAVESGHDGAPVAPAGSATPGGDDGAQDGGAGTLSALPERPGAAGDDELDDEVRFVDPGLDGWETEQLNSAAGARLGELGHWLEQADPARLDWLAPGFSGEPLLGADHAPVHTAHGLVVTRGAGGGDAQRLDADDFASVVPDVRAQLGGGELHLKTKIISVEPGAERRFGTRVLAWIMVDGDAGPAQGAATWDLQWTWPDPATPPSLLRVDVGEVTIARAPAALFSDCSEAVLGDTAAWREQLLRGTDDWCARIDFAARMNQYGHNGLAIGDVDGDGLEDVYLCQTGGLPNRLLRQLPDGRVEDISAAAGVDWLEESRAALLVDLDLDVDGALDLVITTTRGIVLMKGDGQGHFERAGLLDTLGGYSLAAADVDADGLLDLYACTYIQASQESSLPSPYHDANNGPPNVFWRGTGDGLQFEDATAAFGFDDNNHRFSYAASWADVDDDGDLDLYVANDFGRNSLYRNEGGRFRDVAGEAGVEDMAAGMGVSFADMDEDGDLDLYVSNMFSSAGRRIAYQRRYLEAVGAATPGLQRHARGNSLFANRGDGRFDDVTESSGTWMGRWAWGAQFVDLDNDGREDLFVPNGFFTNEQKDDL